MFDTVGFLSSLWLPQSPWQFRNILLFLHSFLLLFQAILTLRRTTYIFHNQDKQLLQRNCHVQFSFLNWNLTEFLFTCDPSWQWHCRSLPTAFLVARREAPLLERLAEQRYKGTPNEEETCSVKKYSSKNVMIDRKKTAAERPFCVFFFLIWS